MIGKKMKKIIIVCNKATMKYGNYLRQLISANDEGEENDVEYESCDESVWDIKHYTDNMANIAISTYFIFIGENKVSKDEIHSMQIKFNQYGMVYGWRGKRAVVIVDKVLSDQDTIEEFASYNKKLKDEGLDKETNNIGAGRAVRNKKAKEIISGFALPIFGNYLANKIFEYDEMKEHQYYSLITTFYLNGLNEFLAE